MVLSGNTQLRGITKEDVEFLSRLQLEMNTQPRQCQADPRFWVVIDDEYLEAADGDNVDRVTFIKDGGSVSSLTLEDAIGFAHVSNKQLHGVEAANETLESHGMYVDAAGRAGYPDVDDAKGFVRAFAEERGMDAVFEHCRTEIQRNTMFLTLREAKEHIKRNHYHYANPCAYAMTAWRSPQVEKLYEILHEVDFAQLLDDKEDSR